MGRFITLVVMAGLLAVPLAAGAQLEALDELKHTTPEQRAGVQTELMKKDLGLSKDQAEKVAAINLEYAEKNDPVLKGDDGMFKKIRLLRKERDAKQAALAKVLTAEQSKKLAASREKLRQQARERLSAKSDAP